MDGDLGWVEWPFVREFVHRWFMGLLRGGMHCLQSQWGVSKRQWWEFWWESLMEILWYCSMK